TRRDETGKKKGSGVSPPGKERQRLSTPLLSSSDRGRLLGAERSRKAPAPSGNPPALFALLGVKPLVAVTQGWRLRAGSGGQGDSLPLFPFPSPLCKGAPP